MFVRLRQAKRLSHHGYRLTLDVVDPERSPWDQGDCVVQVDLVDEPSHHASPRGLLTSAWETYDLSPHERPAVSESRLLWDIGQAVHHYVDRVFKAGIICPFNGSASNHAPERSEGAPE